LVSGSAKEADVATSKPTAEQQGQHAEAVQHIAEAHGILKKLREEADKHPAPREAIAEAMQKLETALAILSVKTGGWL
jgi:predicted translin family RNA/ssDNA-binding protein